MPQEKYIENVLNRFKVQNTEPKSTALESHFKLSKRQSLETDEEREYMVGCLMYAMMCTKPDIVHAMGVVSRYMANLGKVLGRYKVATKKPERHFKYITMFYEKRYNFTRLHGCRSWW